MDKEKFICKKCSFTTERLEKLNTHTKKIHAIHNVSNSSEKKQRTGFTMGQMGQLPRAPTKIGAPTTWMENVMFILWSMLFFRPYFVERNLNTGKHTI